MISNIRLSQLRSFLIKSTDYIDIISIDNINSDQCMKEFLNYILRLNICYATCALSTCLHVYIVLYLLTGHENC